MVLKSYDGYWWCKIDCVYLIMMMLLSHCAIITINLVSLRILGLQISIILISIRQLLEMVLIFI